ncbi:MAG: alpha/beta hydrolase [Hyphomonadaceae bacterium]|nr:alpha/beta hydrolase [Hyphomonadaceae bacterium]
MLAAITLASACALGPSEQRPAAETELRRLVDIGGRSLSLRCTGRQNGPIVVLETGAVASSVLYWPLQDRIATFTRVCTYDRAGLGWSDPVPTGRTFETMADDLDRLLRRAGVRGPFILAGHSMGGFVVRLVAARRPVDIAGVILIDASEERVSLSPDGIAGNDQTAAQLGRLASAAAAGLSTVVDAALPIPPGVPSEAVIIRAPDVIRAGQDELGAFGRTQAADRGPAGLGVLGDIPLIVLSRGRMADPLSSRDLFWREGQLRLLGLSTRSEQMIAERSGHNIHLDQPEAIADAVRRLIEQPKQ